MKSFQERTELLYPRARPNGPHEDLMYQEYASTVGVQGVPHD